MLQMHPEKEMEDAELSSDQDSDNEKSDVFRQSESETDSSMEESGPEDEPDFWAKLIRYAVEEIYTKRKAQGDTGFIPSLTEPQQMAEGQLLSKFMKKLRRVYYHIEDIHVAGCGDPILEKIQNELEKLQEEFDDGFFEAETQEMAWKKYKPFIRKKILENLDEFEELVCNEANSGLQDGENELV